MKLRVSRSVFMGFIGLLTGNSRRTSASTASALSTEASASGRHHSSPMPPSPRVVEDRLRKALWSFFAGDALASPTHWFYGGPRQVQQYYGSQGITGYTKPSFNLAGSILNKSDLSGGGRSKFGDEASSQGKTVIGDVINHGKKDLWSPSKQIHYHATLQKGENTLEAQLARVLMKSIVQTGGTFDPDHFRQAYIDFMMTPDSHNDTYASTCHRMFFANLVFRKLPPKECPDNDGHNVDTVDGLVLPTIVSLAVAARAAVAVTPSSDHSSDVWLNEAAQQAALCASVTRRSSTLDRAAQGWGRMVASTIWYGNDNVQTVRATAESVARSLGFHRPKVTSTEEMTACYLNSAFPALLDSIVTNLINQTPVWQALLSNANTGGENVHRGSCLGAVLGAVSPQNKGFEESQLVTDLYDRESLKREIDEFVNVVLLKQPSQVGQEL